MAYVGKQPQPKFLGQVDDLTVAGDVNVDTNTLVVDADNNRVGINTDSPEDTLKVVGNVGISDHLNFSTGSSTPAEASFIHRPAANTLALGTDSTERMRIDSNGRVGIGESTPLQQLHINADNASMGMALQGADGGACNLFFGDQSDYIRASVQYDNSDESMRFKVNNNSEAMRIDSSGNLLVGTTDNSPAGTSTGSGTAIGAVGYISVAREGASPIVSNRNTNNGEVFTGRRAGATCLRLGVLSGGTGWITNGGVNNDVGLRFNDSSSTRAVIPCTTSGAVSDNTIDLGYASGRFDVIFATNGTIQTSDRNEKQDIATLTPAEMAVAARLSNQFKTFRWIDSVTEKGDNARTHTGIIAQDVQQAFTDEGLDAGDYALFTSSTWWETQTEVPAVEAVDEVLDEDGNVVTEAVEAQEAYTRTDTYETVDEAPEGATERTRLGIRYTELLSFMQAYNDQRMASIEARLDALEAN
jgi:hypothetical protein